MSDLAPLPEDWQRALVVVAHPDDMEYGGAAAVARWTSQGKHVAYLLVTRGEAGIATMAPDEAGPLRVEEQRRACAAVGVDDLTFLDHPDGLVEASIALRRDLAEAVRRQRPELVLSINFRETFGGPSWNHVDHRNVGVALLDAVRDAANPWVFADAGPAWDGTRLVAFGGSPSPTHFVDVTASFDAGVASLAAHRVYLEALGGAMADPDAFLRGMAEAAGARVGVALASLFEVFDA